MTSVSWLRTRLAASRPLRNVCANMIGGAWNGLLIVLATPWYVSLLSLEGYGLLGFWLVMQVMLSLFDLGLGATIVREFADSRENEAGQQRRADLLRTFEYVYWAIAAVVTVALFLAADWIARRWLNLQVFTPDSVALAIRWMALALGLQFPVALYSGGLTGLQAQGRMNFLQMLGNTARYGGGVAILFWKADPVWFFAVQAVVAGAQTLATRMVVLNMVSAAARRASSFRSTIIESLWRYSAGMAFTTIAALLLANVDRLLVSKLMPAEELGKYSLAFTATGLLQMGIQPFYRAYFPRFAELFAVGDEIALRREYYRGCRMVAVIVIPAAVVGWLFAPELFTGWVGTADPTVVSVFRWLMIGIACTGLMWLPAALQQARGWTRLHGSMIAGALVAGAPVMIWTIRAFGTVGATALWVIHGVSGITLELWLMHRRILVGELAGWYRSIVLMPLIVTVPVVGLSWLLMPEGLGRWTGLAWAMVTGAIVSGATLMVVFRGTTTTSELASQTDPS